MKAAIFFSGHYGSTEQYANWIGEATGLPVFDVNDQKVKPEEYDLLILGSSVIIYKLTIRKWVKQNWMGIKNARVILFTVSGAPGGPKLDSWIEQSLPGELIEKMDHVALRGRMDPRKLSWSVRMILRIGAWVDRDPEARKQEVEGFDRVDKASIEPVLRLVQRSEHTMAATSSSATMTASP
jgi:menaquinone-dependent protoporphyrinogen IX oxidase